jgi:hypothetical protein
MFMFSKIYFHIAQIKLKKNNKKPLYEVEIFSTLQRRNMSELYDAH